MSGSPCPYHASILISVAAAELFGEIIGKVIAAAVTVASFKNFLRVLDFAVFVFNFFILLLSFFDLRI
jgi:hypothetical protein